MLTDDFIRDLRFPGVQAGPTLGGSGGASHGHPSPQVPGARTEGAMSPPGKGDTLSQTLPGRSRREPRFGGDQALLVSPTHFGVNPFAKVRPRPRGRREERERHPQARSGEPGGAGPSPRGDQGGKSGFPRECGERGARARERAGNRTRGARRGAQGQRARPAGAPPGRGEGRRGAGWHAHKALPMRVQFQPNSESGSPLSCRSIASRSASAACLSSALRPG